MGESSSDGNRCSLLLKRVVRIGFLDEFRSGGVRERNRRDWDNHGFRRDRPITTKSGRMIKGRGKFVRYLRENRND